MAKIDKIRNYLKGMDNYDLIDLVREVNGISGSYEPWTFFGMDELDEVFFDTTPTELLGMVQDTYSTFSTCDDYFYFDEIGGLQSCSVADAADSIRDDIAFDLANDFSKGRYIEVLEAFYEDLYNIVVDNG